MNQFNMLDLKNGPSDVTIEFFNETYDDQYPDISYLDSEDKLYAQRLAAYERGDWRMLFLCVRAEILIPVGGESYRAMTVYSAGVGGVESDSDADYLDEIFEAERAGLISELKALGKAVENL